MEQQQYQEALQSAYDTHKKIEDNAPQAIYEREKTLFSKLFNSKGNGLTKLKKLYSEMNIIYEYFNTYFQCNKGCSHCCHQEISVSNIEVKFILKNTKAKLNSSPPFHISTNKACPFLVDDKCSIYDFRPYVCREHSSITNSPRWCEFDVCNKYEFPLIRLSEVRRSYEYISNIESHQDLRSIFKPV